MAVSPSAIRPYRYVVIRVMALAKLLIQGVKCEPNCKGCLKLIEIVIFIREYLFSVDIDGERLRVYLLVMTFSSFPIHQMLRLVKIGT